MTSSTTITLSLLLAVISIVCVVFVVMYFARRPRKINENLSRRFLITEEDFKVTNFKVVNAFVIHMFNRTDRLINIKRLEKCLLPMIQLEVLEASDGTDLFKTGKCAKLRKGEIGCFQSHLSILKDIAARDYTSENNWVLIFEDDITLQIPCEQIIPRIRTALNEMPLTAPIVYFGFNDDVLFKDNTRIGKYSYIGPASSGMHAYAIRCIHAHKLVHLLANSICTKPIDIILFENVANAGFVYAREDRRSTGSEYWGKGVFGQDTNSPSDIQTPRRYKRVIIAFENALRKLKCPDE